MLCMRRCAGEGMLRESRNRRQPRRHPMQRSNRSTPHVCSPIRRACCALLLTAVGCPSLFAQGFGPGGAGSPAPPRPPVESKPQRSTGGLSAFATDELVSEIRVVGNKTVPQSRITAQMQTRVGRPFDPKTLARDVRKLASLPYFVTVRPLTERTAGGRVVILEVLERTTIRYVEYLGNEAIKDKKLAKETGLEVGGAVDPNAVEDARHRIEELYHENGYGRVVVNVLEGTQRDDRGVTFEIHEGPKQRVWKVTFEGNEFASDGQLKTKIKTKPNMTRVWGGKFNSEQLEADLDALTDYYRSFGFFRAKVGRVIEYGDDGEWATIKFVIYEGPQYAVRNVSFFGIEKFDPEQVAAGLKLTEGQTFERVKLNADIEWLKDLYGSNGYVFADIQAETAFLEEPGKIDLIYSVEEGDRFRVGRIHVNIGGEHPHTRIQTALNPLSIKPGDIVDTRELRASERRIRASSLWNTNPATGAAPSIRFQIPVETLGQEVPYTTRDEPTFRGQSEPSGPSRPQPYRVRKEPTSVYEVQQASAPNASSTWGNSPAVVPAAHVQAQNATPSYVQPVAAQAPYGGTVVSPTDPTAVDAASSRGEVQQLGSLTPQAAAGGVQPTQFGPPVLQQNQGVLPPPPGSGVPVITETIPPGAVNTQIFPSQVYAPSPMPPPNDPTVDLYINLEETQTGRFSVGVAVNSDAGLVGQILLDERNFDWRRVPRSWRDVYDGTAFRGGGQRFRLEAAPGTEVARYLMSWQEPYLFDTPISLSLSGSFYDRRFDDWDEQRLGGRVGLGYQWTDRDLSAQLTYRGENVNIHDVVNGEAATDPEYQEMLGDNALHGFGVRVIHDTRDNPFFATAGTYCSFSAEAVVGDFDYPRGEFEMRNYFLLRERPDHTGRHVLVWQTRLGVTGNNTPIYDRFFAGGYSTMRGFDFRGASPTRGVSNYDVGGDFMWLNTLEYLFPLTADNMIHGVAFVDYGTVADSVSLEDFRVAPGLGLRIMVPALGPAPIALDFAWPVESASFDEEQVFTFNIGWMR